MAPTLYNWMMRGRGISSFVKSITGISEKRSMPPLYHTTLKKWMQKLSTLPAVPGPEAGVPRKQVYVFCDEFTIIWTPALALLPSGFCRSWDLQFLYPGTWIAGGQAYPTGCSEIGRASWRERVCQYM